MLIIRTEFDYWTYEDVVCVLRGVQSAHAAYIQCIVNKNRVSEKLTLAVYVKNFGLGGIYIMFNFKSTFSFPWPDNPSGPRPFHR